MKYLELVAPSSSVVPRSVVRGRPNPTHRGFVARLKRARKAAKQTRLGLSKKAGLPDNSTVYVLEQGERIPRVDTVAKIASALALSPGLLAYGLADDLTLGAVPSVDGIGDRLRSIRLAQGLSVLALSRLAAVSHTAIGNIERGTMPTIATAESLADALGISPAWLAFAVGPRVLPNRRKVRTAQPDARD